jgi:hypothetical protein
LRWKARRAVKGARSSPTVLDRRAYERAVTLLTGDCQSVLDVGTGTMRSLQKLAVPLKIGLDAHRPYLLSRVVHDAVPINASALSLDALFVPDAVDVITLMDVIEHFERDDARHLLRQAESVAARRVVLFTPRGEFPQENFDVLGLGGEELQRHRSTWDVPELSALGYSVIVLAGFHDEANPAFVAAFDEGARPIDALLAWKDLS